MPYWCVGAALGWIGIPLMQANLDVVMRSHIPLEMQGRVWSVRNTLQFFTIPLGYFLGGWLVDRVFEPLLAGAVSPWIRAVFGTGKGAGAAAFFLVLFGLAWPPAWLFVRTVPYGGWKSDGMQPGAA